MILLLTILIAIILVGIAIALIRVFSGAGTPWPYYGGGILAALVLALVFYFLIWPAVVGVFGMKIPIPTSTPTPVATSSASTSTPTPTVVPTPAPTVTVQATNTPTPMPTVQPTQVPTAMPTPSPTATPSPTPMVAATNAPTVDLVANLQANDPTGIVWDIPADGVYLVKVSDSYNTGPASLGGRDRTLVGLLQAKDTSQTPTITPSNHSNEPVADIAVGNYNTPGNYQQPVILKKGMLLVFPVDDLTSYADNTGSVHVEITNYP